MCSAKHYIWLSEASDDSFALVLELFRINFTVLCYVLQQEAALTPTSTAHGLGVITDGGARNRSSCQQLPSVDLQQQLIWVPLCLH